MAKQFEAPEDKLTEAKKFLDSFGIDVSDMKDTEVIEMMHKVNKATEENIQVLSRGASTDGMQRLLDKVPTGFVGEFKGNTDLEIDQARAIGWEVFQDESVKKDSVTAGSDRTVKLADCVLMVMPVEKYIAIRMVKRNMNKLRREAHKPAKQAEASKSELELPVEVF